MLRLLLIVTLCFPCCKIWSQVIIDTVCPGFTNIPYSVEAHAGSTYQWTIEGGDIASGNGSNQITVNWKKQPGLYRMTVTELNQLGCPGDPVSGLIFLKGTNFKTQHPTAACVNDSVNLVAGGGMWYQWSNGETSSTQKIKLSHDTIMQVIISDTVCGFRIDTMSLSVKAITKPEVSFDANAKDFYKDQQIYLSYTGNNEDMVSWNFEKTLVNEMSGLDVAVRFIDTGEATIKLYSVNKWGCIDSSRQIINIKDEVLFFPTAFTPNGDGINDLFKPGGVGIQSYHMVVFNRWGTKIFETNDPEKGWDGTFDGTLVPTDNYIYQCDAVGFSGKLQAYNGSVSILR